MEEEAGLIKAFCKGEAEPRSPVDIPESLIHLCAEYKLRMTRLSVVEDDLGKVQRLREAVQRW